MKNTDRNKENMQRSQQGTGSAENTGREREEQKNRTVDVNKQQGQQIAGEMGKGPNQLRDIRHMGGMSGRDDYAGGDNDGMSNENSNEPTER
jgi:hypothetical protein